MGAKTKKPNKRPSAAAKRKRADSVSSSDSSDRISVNDAASNASDVDVDFEFLDLNDNDFHGVSLLVTKLLPSTFDFTSLSDCIVSQQNIGVKVVTDSKDGGVCAFGTLLNLRQYASSVPGFSELLEYMRKNTPADSQKYLEISSGNCGLFLGERIINLPPALGPRMHEVLVEDARWSVTPEAECPKDEVGFYKFQEVLVYSSFLLDPEDVAAASAATAGGKKKKKKLRKEQDALNAGHRIYLHAEDEVLVDAAKKSWSWSAGEHDDGEKVYKKHRLCYVLDWDIYTAQVERLAQAFADE